MQLPKADYIEDARSTFEPKSAVFVDMHEGAIVTPNSQYAAIGTNSLATCIGFTVHNPVTKATGLCHLVSDGIKPRLSDDSENSLIHVLNSVKAGMDVELEVRMLGAYFGEDLHDGMINQILDIASDYNIIVLSADLKGKAGPKGFAVDSNRWDEGMIRGGADMVDFMNDPSTGGIVEMMKQKGYSVDLTEMTTVRFDPTKPLIYDGTIEEPQPKLSYE